MTDDQYEILIAAGIDPGLFKVTAFVPDHVANDAPAIITGLYDALSRPAFAAAVARRTGGGWRAVATLSATDMGAPVAVLGELDRRRLHAAQERARYAQLDVNTPDGLRPARDVLPEPDEAVLEGKVVAEETPPPPPVERHVDTNGEPTPLPPGFEDAGGFSS